VYDTEGNPIIGCNVYIENTYYGSTTDLNGYFNLHAIVNDSSNLKIEFIGYEALTIPTSSIEDKQDINLIMKEAFNKLKAVTVTAGRMGTGEKTEVAVLSSLDVITTWCPR